MPSIISYTQPWELRQRGNSDRKRHDRRVKDAIRENLHDLISREDIVVSDGTKKITIPLRYLEQYRFKYGQPGTGVGQGPGTIGDILAQPGQPGSGIDGAGDQPGEHEYEAAEVDLEMVTRMMLEDMALPWLESKPAEKQIASETYQFTDVRRRGMPGNLRKKLTLIQNIKRNAARGEPGIHDLADADMRYRVWDIHFEKTTNAAVYLLLDWSGSMTSERKAIAKCVCFWMVRFLRLKYQAVEIVFIAHDTEAEIVTEADFFGKSEGGGTRCSSALTVALRHMTQYHPKARFNNYCFHFSDGDNEHTDNPLYLVRLADLLQECTMIGYSEIHWASAVTGMLSGLREALQQVQNKRFIATVLRTKGDVHRALHEFLGANVTAVT